MSHIIWYAVIICIIAKVHGHNIFFLIFPGVIHLGKYTLTFLQTYIKKLAKPYIFNILTCSFSKVKHSKLFPNYFEWFRRYSSASRVCQVIQTKTDQTKYDWNSRVNQQRPDNFNQSKFAVIRPAEIVNEPCEAHWITNLVKTDIFKVKFKGLKNKSLELNKDLDD